jgi:hypothetical protein
MSDIKGIAIELMERNFERTMSVGKGVDFASNVFKFDLNYKICQGLSFWI